MVDGTCVAGSGGPLLISFRNKPQINHRMMLITINEFITLPKRIIGTTAKIYYHSVIEADSGNLQIYQYSGNVQLILIQTALMMMKKTIKIFRVYLKRFFPIARTTFSSSMVYFDFLLLTITQLDLSRDAGILGSGVYLLLPTFSVFRSRESAITGPLKPQESSKYAFRTGEVESIDFFSFISLNGLLKFLLDWLECEFSLKCPVEDVRRLGQARGKARCGRVGIIS